MLQLSSVNFGGRAMRTICTYSYHGLFLPVVDSEPFTRSFHDLYSKSSLSESSQIRPLHMLPRIDYYLHKSYHQCF